MRASGKTVSLQAPGFLEAEILDRAASGSNNRLWSRQSDESREASFAGAARAVSIKL